MGGADLATYVDEEQETRVISTGSGELDKKMGGGIPISTLTLVEGMSGAGKSTLTQHLLWGALTAGLDVVIYTTENTVKSLVKQMQSLGMDISDYFLMDILRIYPVETNAFEGDAVRAFDALSTHIEQMDDYTVFVFDSLSTFLTRASEDDILAFFSRMKMLCDGGRAVICTAHSHAFEERVLTQARSVCDAHLRLLVEPGASELVKTMEIAKVRGADLATGSIISFSIEPGIGMRIIPISKARA